MASDTDSLMRAVRMAVNKYKVGDMFYFGPHRAWGLVTNTDNGPALQLVDYVLMSTEWHLEKPLSGTVRYTKKCDSAIKLTNAVAQGKLQYFPAKGKNNG